MRFDFSKDIFQHLFGVLYKRVADFARTVGDAEVIARQRFIRLLADDPGVILLVDLDETGVKSHCLVLLSQIQPESVVAFCDQIQVDAKHDAEFVKACIAYVEALPGVTEISAFTDPKKARAFEKQYGFKAERVLMKRQVERA